MKKKTTFNERRRGFMPFCLSLCFFMALGSMMTPLGAVEHSKSGNEQHSAQTVKQVLSYIEANSDYVILYSKDLLEALDKQVSIPLDGEKVEKILEKLASAANLECKINGRQVVVAPKAVAGQAPQQSGNVKVTGQIIDEKGESIPGANISVKGQSGKGTVSDMDGNFTLNVPRGSVLVVSFVGFVSTEYKVDGPADNLKLQLHPDAETLDEVVVVGYGMQRQSSITGAISSVKADELKGITTPSVSNLLQGKVAGVVATSTSGQPGAGVSIRIRGTGSIQGNQEALWVIDGVVGSSSAELNPNDIESISILKDGSATALYGSRGANGVIQVTTKRAKMGTSQVSLSAKFGVSTLQRGKLRMMNGAEYYDYLYEAFTNAGTLESQVWLQPYLRDCNFDWWDYATQNALTQNYNIGYQFGNDKIRSYISGDYYTEDGTIKGFDYQRFTLRSNTDYIVNKRLTLKANIAASYKETFNQQHSLAYTSYTPWDTPYDSQGNLKDGSQGMPDASVAETADPRDYWYSDGGTNYAYDRHLNWSKSRQNAMDLGVGAEYKIFDWLVFRSNNRFGFTNNYSSSYTDPTSRGGAGTDGSFYDANSNTRSIYASQVLNMLKTFGDKHEINAYLGYEYDEYRYWDLSATAYKIFQGAEIINAGADDPAASGTKTEQKNMAVFFNGNYTFDSKYLFQLMVRHDGSSRFGANKRWATFWSVGAGWNMHEEEWIKDLGWINQLKPRIS
ncbi:MAG: SusC/RagA family TonB-linked outer membrane protein, partial [Candidatus Bacteroides intestinipullorum]|nr:SusC/RagA family TonB-linked outer membrane protein [Candidatus Bacteroides intestinipullorum]